MFISYLCKKDKKGAWEYYSGSVEKDPELTFSSKREDATKFPSIRHARDFRNINLKGNWKIRTI